jgi:hypothetical protein
VESRWKFFRSGQEEKIVRVKIKTITVGEITNRQRIIRENSAIKSKRASM